MNSEALSLRGAHGVGHPLASCQREGLSLKIGLEADTVAVTLLMEIMLAQSRFKQFCFAETPKKSASRSRNIGV